MTPAGLVPQVKTRLGMVDHLGRVRCRIGLRTDYMVQPGLYRIGEARPDSPVIVTANYKLSFDLVRAALDGMACWLLVTNTDGINVWCAGGKGKFNAQSVAEAVLSSGLEQVVSHRELVLPQLAANGVSAHELRKLCGFKGVYGPIRATDIKRYLQNGPEESMRRVSFTLAERLELAPLEVALSLKWVALFCVVGFLLSGIGPSFWSLSAAWARGQFMAWATFTGLFAGALVAPALLPWLPGRPFALKGVLTGFMTILAVLLPLGWGQISLLDFAALTAWSMLLSSYLTMNFTGSTPFTSPTGVEQEMRQFLPWQAIGVVLVLVSWVAAPFV